MGVLYCEYVISSLFRTKGINILRKNLIKKCGGVIHIIEDNLNKHFLIYFENVLFKENASLDL
jgi:hypothetical protein